VTTEILLEALGKSSSTPEVSGILRQLDATIPLRLKKGDTKVNVPSPKLGIELVFADEAFFLKRRDMAIGEGELLLTAVMFNAEGLGKWKAYAGVLPFALRFSNLPPEVYDRLGRPEWSNDLIGNNRWTKDGRWLFVVFAPDKQSIRRVIVQVPDRV
jgi:hypothetical protein